MLVRKILLLLPVLLLTGCFSFKPVVPEKIRDVKVNSLDAKGIDLSLVLNIRNPNGYRIRVKHVDLDLSAAGMKLGKVQLRQQIVIPARSSSEHTIQLQTSFRDAGLAAIPGILGIIKDRKLVLTGEGEIRAGVFILSKNFRVSFSEEVKF